MEPFATVADLALGWELDEDEIAQANWALESLSDDARFYGSSAWTKENAPRQVRNLVIKAATKWLTNTDGYIQSRAGDESVMWSENQVSSTPEFTKDQKGQLRTLAYGARGSGLITAPTMAWGPYADDNDTSGYVPVSGGGKSFPYYPGVY